MSVRWKTGQSGTAESWRKQNALTSELPISWRIDKYVDCAVGVCQPHYGEFDSGRRLEWAKEALRKIYDAVRRPEHEICDTGECENLHRSSTTDSVRSPNSVSLLTVPVVQSSWSVLMKFHLDKPTTLQCRSDAQYCENKNCSRQYRDVEAGDYTVWRILPV